MTIDIQQGDVKLRHTLNDGEITVVNGVTSMDSGLAGAAYLSLFGGNQDDDGSTGSNKGWWGNIGETVESRKYVSKLQNIMDGIPAISSNLNRLQSAAEEDLQWLLDEKVASSVVVTVSLVAPKRININIVMQAQGELHEFNFTENWQFEAA